jgi:hypothetical protein
MNVMGKILVVLNLLFALAVGAFLVIDFGLRKDWKAAHDELKTQLDNVKTNTDGMAKTNQGLNDKLQKAEQEATQLKNQLVVLEKDQQTSVANLVPQNAQYDLQIQEAITRSKTFQQQAKDLANENTELKTIIGDYGTLIAKLQDDNKDEFQKRVQAENGLQTSLQRNDFLVRELADLYKKIARQNTDPKADPTSLALLNKDPGSPNPPAVTVNSKIIEIGSSGDLVRLDTGSDAGLKKGHTLDVYRTAPARQYLGMIRIVDVGPLEAIGQRVTTGPHASQARYGLNDLVISDVYQTP